ncbi:MAG: glutaminyl-tRNA synthase (glutamine-hydrolyzing) subunit B [Candidatus Jacksonbacteria bacterium RIFCSPLOWO2_02_FULL_43_9]|nr:MAG: glutaminyl-tRNA synthase (glutamine-hydrolyzing) subunit B [Candidatus Jacksonbacteria bacterium RIFCSPHIGHO2_02_FULL_43_10]OGY70359.1 MAG: glutaminyl-tRNA synthase (glutamine-hydrolyzing) subunit B [Candidatus Jacksonbacteria bacterium RIFCSPLOWO2_01_FULL_44_13]OGY72697.1 MAG: glutaminyl-tRNA synthase (glutamine-hydrolyzing) subunit B [Candidatus Jacksonbacteria bacterium RIFCSPLOWO2_02_FULL_43_9]
MTLETIIGLEIHIQLKTCSKMFSPADNRGEYAPMNTAIHEIDLAHPGTLPVPNRDAIISALKMALALECDIPEQSKFDRKHYFYPDLPKGYQISQYDQPLGTKGVVVLNDGGEQMPIRIHRLHLEEDAAKLLHDHTPGSSVVDHNRAGTPLIEIVTEPDVRTSAQAGLFLKELRMLARALDISDADMEKGHLRCDANISLRPAGDTQLYPKTEIKNLNSFRAVEKALEYEIKRLTKLWEQGNPPSAQSTRGWDEHKGETIVQREKEDAKDYRYFPDPDIPPLRFDLTGGRSLDKEGVGGGIISIPQLRESLPELPQQMRARFISQYEFSYADAYVLTEDRDWAEFAEQTITELRAWLLSLETTEGSAEEVWEKHGKKLAQLVGNWLINKLATVLNASGARLRDTKVTPENFAELLALVFEHKVNSSAAQVILGKVFETGDDPRSIMGQEGLEQVSDSAELDALIAKAIAENPSVVTDYKGGKENAIMFLVGSVMKESKGKANPQMVKEMLMGKMRDRSIT